MQSVLRPLAGRCLGPYSPAPAPRSTCAGVCDTALTSVGASSQSGAGKRSPANRGRGRRLCGQGANEGQCLALCNPPPSLAEVLLRSGLKQLRAGGWKALAPPGRNLRGHPCQCPSSSRAAATSNLIGHSARALRQHKSSPSSLWLSAGTYVLLSALHRVSTLLTRSYYLHPCSPVPATRL